MSSKIISETMNMAKNEVQQLTERLHKGDWSEHQELEVLRNEVTALKEEIYLLRSKESNRSKAMKELSAEVNKVREAAMSFDSTPKDSKLFYNTKVCLLESRAVQGMPVLGDTGVLYKNWLESLES